MRIKTEFPANVATATSGLPSPLKSAIAIPHASAEVVIAPPKPPSPVPSKTDTPAPPIPPITRSGLPSPFISAASTIVGRPPTVYCVCGRPSDHTSELQSLRHLVCRLLLEKNQYQQT